MQAAGHAIPVIGLAYTSRELHEFRTARDTRALERLFLWQGDVRILLAMVMYLEDRLNAERDTLQLGVPAILVVEDNVRFYSSFLPAIYTELLRHTDHLLAAGLNPSQKMMRMRARPKVLLCETYEEALELFDRFPEQILGVISDFEFPREGELDARAGLRLCLAVQEQRPEVPLVLQSSRPENQALAEEIGASFLLKGSPVLLTRLRQVLVQRFGFGDFVFRTPGRPNIERAQDLRSLARKLRTVPAASVAYHAKRQQFSHWLKVRTEFLLAERLRPRQVEDFEDTEALRAFLLREIDGYRREQQRTVIAGFDRTRFEPAVSITRIGGGSLGGKARGVAFANRILRGTDLDERYPEVDVYVPPSVVLGTDVFDEFLQAEGLLELAMSNATDEAIVERFVEAPFPRAAISDLRAFLERVKYPLAVRSSSLLEDSLSQPFAGVYRTYMLANNDPELDVRWRQLATAIKRVYASVFMQQAKSYLSMTSFRLEEEKMAVMIQELVGTPHPDRFYPDFAGVARSYNFYPESGQCAEDGVVAVALGFGQTVVGGDPCLRFCPKYPRQLTGFSSVPDALENSQRQFFGLDLERGPAEGGLARMRRFPLEAAEADGPLAWLGSTYLQNDNRIVDGISRAGVRLVSFAQVLKHEAFPLADVLETLLERCAAGTGGPVEIEFAGTLSTPERPTARFAFLQLRPLALSKEEDEVEIGEVEPEALLCRSTSVLGNGRIDDLRDLVVVDAETFQRERSVEVSREVARFDALLRKEERPYVLVGVGRWGSSDPHLGIPVSWHQIAGARVIVEAGFKDLRVTPSQGTHFFQNLTSSHVGYFTVNPEIGDGVLDWEWLLRQKVERQSQSLRHVQLSEPLSVKMNGRRGIGVILKP